MATPAQWNCNCCFDSAPREPDTLSSPVVRETHRQIAKRRGRIIIELRCQSDDDCPICLEPLKGKTVKYTPCGHCMHSKCLKAQMQSSHPSAFSCSLCRHNLIPYISLDEINGHLRSRMQSPPPMEEHEAAAGGFGLGEFHAILPMVEILADMLRIQEGYGGHEVADGPAELAAEPIPDDAAGPASSPAPDEPAPAAPAVPAAPVPAALVPAPGTIRH